MNKIMISEHSKFTRVSMTKLFYDEFMLHINLAHEFFHLIVNLYDIRNKFDLNPISEEIFASKFAFLLMNYCSNDLMKKYISEMRMLFLNSRYDIFTYDKYMKKNYFDIVSNAKEYSIFQSYTYIKRQYGLNSIEDMHNILIKYGVSINMSEFNLLASKMKQLSTLGNQDSYTKAWIILSYLKIIYLSEKDYFEFLIVDIPNMDQVIDSFILPDSIIFKQRI